MKWLTMSFRKVDETFQFMIVGYVTEYKVCKNLNHLVDEVGVEV